MRSRRRSSPGAAAASRVTRCRARSISNPPCPATPRASSTCASCATRTGRGAAGGSDSGSGAVNLRRAGVHAGPGIAVLTLAVYAQVLHFEFVRYDDPRYVTENEKVLAGLTRESARWAFTTFHKSNWHPLTWLSHMLDVELFGANPAGHHATNVLFHVANALVLLALLRALTGDPWPSAWVAALFAVHPLHVESVAWVSERKDVLSTLFGFLSIAAYGA